MYWRELYARGFLSSCFLEFEPGQTDLPYLASIFCGGSASPPRRMLSPRRHAVRLLVRPQRLRVNSYYICNTAPYHLLDSPPVASVLLPRVGVATTMLRPAECAARYRRLEKSTVPPSRRPPRRRLHRHSPPAQADSHLPAGAASRHCPPRNDTLTSWPARRARSSAPAQARQAYVGRALKGSTEPSRGCRESRGAAGRGEVGALCVAPRPLAGRLVVLRAVRQVLLSDCANQRVLCRRALGVGSGGGCLHAGERAWIFHNRETKVSRLSARGRHRSRARAAAASRARTGVAVREQGADAEQHFGDGERRTPLVLQDICAEGGIQPRRAHGSQQLPAFRTKCTKPILDGPRTEADLAVAVHVAVINARAEDNLKRQRQRCVVRPPKGGGGK